MKRYMLLLLLALTSCATSSERYERGTLTAPPPPAPRLGGVVHGAEALRKPPPQVPRSKGRPLPSTREPGLYAADSPRAAMSKGPWFLGTLLPNPAGVPEQEALGVRCAAELDADLLQVGPRFRVVMESPPVTRFEQKACLAARLYKVCAERHLDGEGTGLNLRRADLDVNAAKAWLARWVKGQCSKTGNTAAVDDVVEAVRQLYLH